MKVSWKSNANKPTVKNYSGLIVNKHPSKQTTFKINLYLQQRFQVTVQLWDSQNSYSQCLNSFKKQKRQFKNQVKCERFKLIFLPNMEWKRCQLEEKEKNCLRSSHWPWSGVFFYGYFVSLSHVFHSSQIKGMCGCFLIWARPQTFPGGKKEKHHSTMDTTAFFLPARLSL